MRRAESQRQRRRDARQSINDSNRNKENYFGAMDVLCLHCQAQHFPDEKVSNKGLFFNDCCSHGSVTLVPIPEFPIQLKKIFQGEHEKSNQFFQPIRYYNNTLAFASFNGNLVNFQTRRPGPFCFKIQGQIYYQINTSLYPGEGENPSNGQLFIIDQQEALNHRMTQNPVLDYELIAMLDTIIRDNNILAKSYEMMHQELNAQLILNNGK